MDNKKKKPVFEYDRSIQKNFYRNKKKAFYKETNSLRPTKNRWKFFEMKQKKSKTEKSSDDRIE